ncbi:hypothetical protein UFOVP193_15 [uncultured Caudovirales phage]|uniref:Uncharacterized protein n=1 Tax=uncultured Caudovirales phage TaxID=2100421 RepID=A0A6J7WGS5_9CAUD|nr:hypothetical protein UFOVP193_15 [uncultured Caudovirales phage]
MTRREMLEEQFKTAKKQSSFLLYLKLVFRSYFERT